MRCCAGSYIVHFHSRNVELDRSYHTTPAGHHDLKKVDHAGHVDQGCGFPLKYLGHEMAIRYVRCEQVSIAREVAVEILTNLCYLYEHEHMSRPSSTTRRDPCCRFHGRSSIYIVCISSRRAPVVDALLLATKLESQ